MLLFALNNKLKINRCSWMLHFMFHITQKWFSVHLPRWVFCVQSDNMNVLYLNFLFYAVHFLGFSHCQWFWWAHESKRNPKRTHRGPLNEHWNDKDKDILQLLNLKLHKTQAKILIARGIHINQRGRDI